MSDEKVVPVVVYCQGQADADWVEATIKGALGDRPGIRLVITIMDLDAWEATEFDEVEGAAA